MLVLTKEEWLDHLHNPTSAPLENVVELPEEALAGVEVKKVTKAKKKGQTDGV